MTTAHLLRHDQDSLRPTTAEALRFYAFAVASVVLSALLLMSLILRAGS